MPDSSPASHAPLLEHLDALYALAQATTDTPVEAARLVEATYQKAAATPASERPSEGGRLWLFRLLTETHEAGDACAETSRAARPAPGGDGHGSLRNYRRKAAERILRRTLPAAFATLPPADRLLLTLCKAENLSCADAGTVLGCTADAACGRLDEASARLHRHLREGASPAERKLLDEALPDAALRKAVQRFVGAEFAAPPSALRPVVETSMAGRDGDAQGDDAHDQTARRRTELRRAERRSRKPTVSKKPAARHAPPPRAARSSAAATQDADGAPSWGDRLKRAAAALLLIGLTGLAGFAVTEYFGDEPSAAATGADLVALSARRAGDVQEITQTSDAAAAARFVREQVGQRVQVPSVQGASLSGVGIVEVAPEVRVPVFIYVDTTGTEDIALYAYTYALLDRYAERVQLDRALLEQLSDEDAFEVRRTEAGPVLIWRDRDDIFMAVSPGSEPEALRQRIAS